MNITYKYMSPEFKEIQIDDISNFVGYEIKFYYNKPTYIRELNHNKVLSIIKLKPTKELIIDYVTYGNGFYEERYNNNNLRIKAHKSNDLYHGECIFYSIDNTICRKFYYNGIDYTDKIFKYLGSPDDFNNYIIPEDKIFNIMLQYDSHFKFINESTKSSTDFNNIVKYCLT